MTSKITPAVRAALEAAVGAGQRLLRRRQDLRLRPRRILARGDRPRSPTSSSARGRRPRSPPCSRSRTPNGIPVTPRGGATGLCGGCVPVCGGIVLSLERMNRVLEIDADNQMAVTEAGVRLSDFTKAVEESGLYFPPHPGDESAMMGGLVATNAGGSRAVKYGTIRNYVRGLELVTAGGRRPPARRQAREVEHRLQPHAPRHRLGGHARRRHQGHPPSQGQARPHALARRALRGARAGPRDRPPHHEAGHRPAGHRVPRDRAHHPDRGAHPQEVADQARQNPPPDHPRRRVRRGDGPPVRRPWPRSACEKGAIDVFIADTPSKQDEVLAIRSKIYDAIKSGTVEILDIAVPRAEVAGHVRKVREVAAKHGVWLPTFGHAADGNVHTHIMKARYEGGAHGARPGERVAAQSRPRPRGALPRLQGARRGHLGRARHRPGQEALPLRSFSTSRQIELMRGIKRVFDPHGHHEPRQDLRLTPARGGFRPGICAGRNRAMNRPVRGE